MSGGRSSPNQPTARLQPEGRGDESKRSPGLQVESHVSNPSIVEWPTVGELRSECGLSLRDLHCDLPIHYREWGRSRGEARDQ